MTITADTLKHVCENLKIDVDNLVRVYKTTDTIPVNWTRRLYTKHMREVHYMYNHHSCNPKVLGHHDLEQADLVLEGLMDELTLLEESIDTITKNRDWATKGTDLKKVDREKRAKARDAHCNRLDIQMLKALIKDLNTRVQTRNYLKAL